MFKILCSLCLFCFFCKFNGEKSAVNNFDSLFKFIPLCNNINVVIPVSKNDYNDSLIYTQIEIWIDSKMIFQDTTHTEYFFEDKKWPQARKLLNKEYEVLIPIFDAPDFNKIKAFYIRDDSIIRSFLLPYFDDSLKDYNDDGRKEFVGIMNISDAYDSNDSCYYNPALYFENSDWGIKLDSNLTIEMNKKSWGDFLGFSQRNIALPCPKKIK